MRGNGSGGAAFGWVTASPDLPPLPALHIVTDDAVVAAPRFTRLAGVLLEAGSDRVAMHLRANAAAGRRMYELACALAEVARGAGAVLFVNDRVDVAAAADAGGVHLGRRSMGPADARRLLGPARLLGASVHSVQEAAEVAGDVDFLMAGSVYPTRSHPGRPGAGADLVDEIARLGRPVVAIGGVERSRVAELRRAGAAGVAVLSGIWHAADPETALRGYLSELE